jgi:hypothetical protein
MLIRCKSLLFQRTAGPTPLFRTLIAIGFLVMAIALSCRMLSAQVSTADVVGTVTDTTGGVVPHAKVTIKSLTTGVNYEATSNDAGEIAVSQLPAGHYSISINAPGFKRWTIADFALGAGDRYRVVPSLAVGSVDQVVTVTADAAPLQTDTSTVSASINEVQTQNLPVSGRNVLELAQYAPGATDYKGGGFSGTPDDQRRDSTISISGRTGAENNFLIDGQDNNERFVNTILVKPSEDGIAELRVVSNSPSAELSRAAGATIILITKGGTNKIHGSAYEFLRNEVLDAYPQNTAPGSSKPSHKQHNFGGSIGGPIKQNRLFYFGDFETYKSKTGTVNVSTVPTAAMRLGNFDGVADIFDPNTATTVEGVTTRTQFQNNTIPNKEINSIAQTLINLYPLPNIPGAGLNNNFSFTTPLVQTDRTVDTRFDLKMSSTNTLFVRYNYDKADTTLPYRLPDADGYKIEGIPNGCFPYCYGYSGTADQVVNSAGVIDTKTLSSNAVLILRAGYGRYQNQALPAGWGTTPATALGMVGVNTDAFSSGFPDFVVSSFTGLGAGNFYPTINTNNAFSYGGSLQVMKGPHLFKVGGEFVRRQVSDHQSQEPKIGYTFTPSFTGDPQNFSGTGDSMASLLMGYPASTLRVRYLIWPGYRTLENGWYAQDDYRATRHLTFNLGLRYDYYSPLSEVRNRISNFDYATAKVIVAGENGIGNTAGVNKDFVDFGPRVGFSLQVGEKSTVFGGFGMSFTPEMLGTPGAMRNAPFISNMSINPDLLTPINSISDPIPALVADSTSNPIGWFWAVDRNYKLPYVEQFNLNVQRQLPFGIVFTTGYVGSLGKRESGSNNVFPRNGAAPGAAPVQTRRPLYSLYPNLAEVYTVHGYYDASYHSMQTSLVKHFGNGMSFNINNTWSHAIDSQEVRYYTQTNWGTIKGTSSSDIRERLSAILVYDVPYKGITSRWLLPAVRNWSINSIVTAETGLPFEVLQVGEQTNGADGTNRPNQIASAHVDHPSASEWFNTKAFQAQSDYTWGNEGHNQLNAPGTWNIDLGVHRDFNWKQRLTTQFRFEAFDLTNTRHPNAPNNYLGSSGFGSITTYNSNRTVQVALKLLF